MTFRLCVVLLVLSARDLSSQTLPGRGPVDDYRSPLHGEIGTLLLNAFAGGLVAGIGQGRDPASFGSAFWRGAAGGAAVYAGKRISVERWWGAGLVGRQVSAVGASVVANAYEGEDLLSLATLPLGPVRVRVGVNPHDESRFKIDLPATIALTYAVLLPEMKLDASESLSSGAPVFHTRGRVGGRMEGKQSMGVIRIAADQAGWADPSQLLRTLKAHERVHVLQHDFALTAIGVPLQRELLRNNAAGRVINRYVDVGIHQPAWSAISLLIPYKSRPWEREAEFLSHRSADPVTYEY
jgi:hypothetical protein